MNTGAIFPLFYLPPIPFFSEIAKYKEGILIEKEEHFPKQTYRNRTSIYSPQGKLDLIVPVVKGSKFQTKIKDVKISYDFKWQRLHWLSIQTAYRNSAFFEYYEDALIPFYERKWEYLFDYNEELLQLLLKQLKLNISYSLTETFEKELTGYVDYRQAFPAKQPLTYTVKPYFQVFEDKNGFIPNLSILDLLFNQGPQSGEFF